MVVQIGDDEEELVKEDLLLVLLLGDLVEEELLLEIVFENLVKEEILLVLVLVSSLKRSWSTGWNQNNSFSGRGACPCAQLCSHEEEELVTVLL